MVLYEIYPRLSMEPRDLPVTTIIWFNFRERVKSDVLNEALVQISRMSSYDQIFVAFTKPISNEWVVFISEIPMELLPVESEHLLIESLIADWKKRPLQSVFMSSTSPSITPPTAPWNSLLPLLVELPDIYNVPFEGSYGGSRPRPGTSTQIDEILIWKYMKPADSLHQDQCERDLRSIDEFLGKSTPVWSDDLPCPLITYHRGWSERDMGLSRTLISLFSWDSAEAESRFKNPLESSLSYEWDTEADLYKKSFLEPVKYMQQNGWISPERQVHLRLRFWRPPKALA